MNSFLVRHLLQSHTICYPTYRAGIPFNTVPPYVHADAAAVYYFEVIVLVVVVTITHIIQVQFLSSKESSWPDVDVGVEIWSQ